MGVIHKQPAPLYREPAPLAPSPFSGQQQVSLEASYAALDAPASAWPAPVATAAQYASVETVTTVLPGGGQQTAERWTAWTTQAVPLAGASAPPQPPPVPPTPPPSAGPLPPRWG